MGFTGAKRSAMGAIVGLFGSLIVGLPAHATSGPATGIAPGAVTTRNARAVADPGSYRALTPTRILDTRIGNGAPAARVAARATLELAVLGRGGVPATGVSAVVFNLTAVGPSAVGYLTAYPSGQAVPTASSANFVTGENRAHLVVVAPGTNGKVTLLNGSDGSVDLLADVAGYYTAGTPTAGGEFGVVSPARVFDSRTGLGGPKAPLDGRLDSVTLQVTGRGGIPSTGVASVVMNLTATRGTTSGYLTVTPNGTFSAGFGSSVNFVADRSVSNLVVTPVRSGGTVTVTGFQDGRVDVVLDVVGYFVEGPPAAAGRFGGFPSSRLLDTRKTASPVPAHGTITLAVAGHDHVPSSGASAAMLNVTVASPTVPGFLATYPTGVTRPVSSTVNFARSTTANFVIAPLGSDGAVRIYNGSSSPVQLVVDVSGFVGPIPGPLTWAAQPAIPVRPSTVTPAISNVSCGRATFCLAGDQTGGSYRFDGHAWTVLPVIDPIVSLSCVASGFCAALTWGGPYVYANSTWTRTASIPGVSHLSCTSSTFCVATNDEVDHVDSWVYNGNSWSASIPTGIASPYFSSLSCSSARSCLAVALGGDTARFDGTRWTVVGRLAVPGGSSVSSVSCVSVTFCMALDGFSGLAVVFDGTRWATPTRLYEAAHYVSCASRTTCVAAGAGDQMIYNGTSWTTPLLLDANLGNDQIVSCTAPRFCLVVSDEVALSGS